MQAEQVPDSRAHCQNERLYCGASFAGVPEGTATGANTPTPPATGLSSASKPTIESVTSEPGTQWIAHEPHPPPLLLLLPPP